MVERHLRHELARRQIAPALELKQKAFRADHRAGGESGEQAGPGVIMVGSGYRHMSRGPLAWVGPAATAARCAEKRGGRGED
jgi:hypothetical protein